MVWKDGIDYYGYYVILGLKIWVDYFDKLMVDVLKMLGWFLLDLRNKKRVCLYIDFFVLILLVFIFLFLEEIL